MESTNLTLAYKDLGDPALQVSLCSSQALRPDLLPVNSALSFLSFKLDGQGKTRRRQERCPGHRTGAHLLPMSECLLRLHPPSTTASWAHPCFRATALPCPTAHKGHCPDPPRYPGLLVALAYTERLHPISSQLHFFTVTR